MTDAGDSAPIPHLPLIEEADDTPHVEAKPLWRGWLHTGITPIAVVLGVVLVAVANGAEAEWACAVFALTSVLLFGNSAVYHRINWSPKRKLLFKRIDHSNIFLLIAGTYTPLALLALPPKTGVPLFVIVWAVALAGICFRIFWIGAPRWLYVLAYLGLGFSAFFQLGPLFAANAPMMTLVLVGGAIYTVGALAYGLKRPNPIPGVFGFHEVFHACTVLAFACHWTAVLLIALHPVT